MKTLRNCFSLVELIIVLTIMAIITALCAPNLSAYVLAAKAQNYQTSLNNLMDELEIELTQNRYWNWDEVPENAEAILRSDASRSVTLVSSSSTEYVYEVSNICSDANITFRLTLTYEDSASVTTEQTIKVSAVCTDTRYSSVKVEEETCQVMLKTNYTDASTYPVVSYTTTTSEVNGWKELGDRVKTYTEWLTWVEDHPENDFSNDASYPDSFKNDCSVINITDYAANSAKFIQFELPFYSGFTESYGYYAYLYVCTNDGAGTGKQYSPAQYPQYPYYDNVYIYIGADDTNLKYISYDEDGDEVYDDEEDLEAHDWVRWDKIFQKNINYGYTGFLDSYYNIDSENANYVAAFKARYDTEILQNENGDYYCDTEITYRVLLKNDSGEESSRGWIVVTGGADSDSTPNEIVYPSADSVFVYVDNGEMPSDLSTILYNSDVEQSGFTYFDDTGLTETAEENVYFDSAGYHVVLESMDIAGSGVSVYYVDDEDDTEYAIQKDDAGYYIEYLETYTITLDDLQCSYKSSIPFVYWNPGDPWIIQEDDKGLYFEYPSINGTLKKSDYLPADVFSVGYTINYFITDSWNYDHWYFEKTYTVKYYLSDEDAAIVTEDLARVKKYYYGVLYFDVNKTGYRVGDELQILLENVDSDYIIEYYDSINYFYLVSNTTQANNDCSGSMQNPSYTIEKVSDTSVLVTVELTWDLYPYLRFGYIGALSESGATVTVNINATSTLTSTSIVTTSIPMLTINGDDSYANITLDWSQCVSAVSLYPNELGVTFTLNGVAYADYIVYDSDYNLISFSPLSTVYLSQISGVDVADGVVHFYFRGISASDLTAEIEIGSNLAEELEPEEAITTTTVAATTTETTSISTTETTSISTTETTSTSTTETTSTSTTETTSTSTAETTSTSTAETTNTSTTATTSTSTLEETTESTVESTETTPEDSDEEGTTTTAEVLTIDEFTFDESYDISEYFYLNDSDAKIPSKLILTFTAGELNTGYNFIVNIGGTFNLQYDQYTYWNSTGDVFVYYTGDTYTSETEITVEIDLTANSNYQTLSTSGSALSDTVLRLSNYYASDYWNNITLTSIAFVYEESTAVSEEETIELMNQAELINNLLTLSVKVNASATETEPAARTVTTTTTTATSTTTTTTTTEAPTAASEDGIQVGLDEETAACCTIQFESPLFSDSGICYFTITPKAGYTLSEDYTVTVGGLTLSSDCYSESTGQWFFWKSSGITNFTVHVDGVVEDTA